MGEFASSDTQQANHAEQPYVQLPHCHHATASRVVKGEVMGRDFWVWGGSKELPALAAATSLQCIMWETIKKGSEQDLHMLELQQLPCLRT
eukprot:1143502-Pelagomonas_calceolata.AAC.5